MGWRGSDCEGSGDGNGTAIVQQLLSLTLLGILSNATNCTTG